LLVRDENKKRKLRREDFQKYLFFLGNIIGNLSGLYKGMRETKNLTGSVRTSS